MTKQAWPQPRASERMARTGTGYLQLSHLLLQQHCPAWHKAHRITQGFACRESSWDTELRKRQRLPAMATRMTRASLFTCTIWNDDVTPPRTPRNWSGGQAMTEKGHTNNQIYAKKRLCTRHLPKMPFTGKLIEQSTWRSLKKPKGVKWKNGKVRLCRCH